MRYCFICHNIHDLLQIVHDVSNIVCVHVVPFQKSIVTGSFQSKLELQDTKLSTKKLKTATVCPLFTQMIRNIGVNKALRYSSFSELH